MATYYAATRIKYAVDDDGNVCYEPRKVVDSKYFEPGDEVTGLSNEDMASLWDAGSLYTSDDWSVRERVTGMPREDIEESGLTDAQLSPDNPERRPPAEEAPAEASAEPAAPSGPTQEQKVAAATVNEGKTPAKE